MDYCTQFRVNIKFMIQSLQMCVCIIFRYDIVMYSYSQSDVVYVFYMRCCNSVVSNYGYVILYFFFL